ncbi:hypothetical protein N9K99_04840 [Schleiferiaceae bacterium]|nr:hypothetical protein [Schleiferiaceae bacterium]
MVILHDFNLEIEHFALPDSLKIQIELSGFKIVDIDKASHQEKNECSIFFGNRIKSEDLMFLPNLRYIHLGCVGYNNLNIEELKEKKIVLSNSSNIVEEAMAEMTMAAILWFNKRIFEMDELPKISRTYYDKFYSDLKLLRQTKVLIYGYGLVGRKTAEFLRKFTDHITVVKRDTSKVNSELVITPEKALSVVHEYDYIVNCLPLNISSAKYFNRDYFKRMNRQAVYVSIGRSGTTEIDDLIREIDLENIRGCYLDVYEEIDLKKLNPIANRKILITPHISGWHNEYWRIQSMLCVKNFIKYREEKYSEIDNLIVL